MTLARTMAVKCLVKRYGLAVCCIISPLFFGVVALDEPTKRTIPPGITKISAQFAPATGVHQITVPPQTTAASTKISKPDPDPDLYLQSQYIFSLYVYAILNSSTFLGSAIIIILAGFTIIPRLGVRIFAIALCIGSAFSYIFAMWNGTADTLPNPLFESLLRSIDEFPAVKTVRHESGTMRVVFALHYLNKFLGFLWCAMAAFALAVLSIRADESELTLPELMHRRTGL
jgi:hypothetical protein